MYEWCKLAGGRFFAAMGSMLYWISNPLWVGGSLAVGAIAAIKLLWFGSLMAAALSAMPSSKCC
jgi:hypothetical protein